MSFHSAQFITGAVTLEGCPEALHPEFCFAGRSNVGKSSLINRIANRKKLARTSNRPGKTQQMNYYLIDDAIWFVDLPGFGYAKVPKAERERWGKEIRNYLINRKTISLIFHLVDARHDPTDLDEEFFYWMGTREMPFSVLLTKIDKLSINKRNQASAKLKKVLTGMNIEVPVISCSSETGDGIDEVRSLIEEFSKQTVSEPEFTKQPTQTQDPDSNV